MAACVHWNIELLVKHGFTDAAETAKMRYLRLLAAGRDISENHSTDPLQPRNSGVARYTFGTGTLVQLLLNWHQKPL